MVSVGTWMQRLRRVNPVVWDSLLAAMLFVITGASVVATARIEPIWAWTLAVLLCAPLALRRRAPLAVLAVVSSTTAVIAIAGDAVSAEAALALAVYSAAAHRSWRQVETIALPISVAGASVALLQAQRHGNGVEVLVGLLAWVGFPLLLGRIVFNRRERILQERETATREAISAERARIARELHDVVAHAISVMVVQASAARVVVDHDPAAAKEAIRKVEETGRGGLAEMRRLIDRPATRARSARPLARHDARCGSARGGGSCRH
jgi:signal transduction histidine kinase